MATKPTPVASLQPPQNEEEHGVQVEENIDQPMAAQAEAVASTSNVDSITSIIQAIGRDMNTEKAKIAVALLNVTNFAVQLQGRSAWNTRDFMSYGIALASLSQIDKSDPSQSGRIRAGVDMDALARAIGQPD